MSNTLGDLLRIGGRSVLDLARRNVQLERDRLEAEQHLVRLVRWARRAGFTEARHAKDEAQGKADAEPYDTLLEAERYLQKRRVIR